MQQRLFLALVASCFVAYVAADCSYVDIADLTDNAYTIHFADAVGSTLDANNQSVCYKNEPDIKFPGGLKLISGTVTVKSALNLINNTQAYLTLKKNSWLIGTVCKDGNSNNALVPDEDCRIPLCVNSTETSFCTLLGTPGVHNLSEIENSLDISNVLIFPDIPSSLNGILKGQWQITISIRVGGQEVGVIKAPSNEDYIYINE